MMARMLDRTDIEAALASLGQRRPVFHSEADFQFALAWEIQGLHPNIKVRLEYPVPLDGERGEIDIWLRDAEEEVAIELKYWTQKAELTVNKEPFTLKERAFKNLYLYDFWKDVVRTEALIAEGPANGGYVIAVTNDQFYWNAGGGGAAYEAFRMNEGRVVPLGTLAWSGSPSREAIRGREEPHKIRGRYHTRWRDYSAPAPGPGGTFRYLLLDVGAALAEGET